MILIISQDRYEQSTDQVIDYLDYLGVDFYRLNGIDFIKKAQFIYHNGQVELRLKGFPALASVSVVWFRRWFSFQNKNDLFLENREGHLEKQLNEIIRSECKNLVSFFLTLFPENILFSKMDVNEINKLSVLKHAIELKILIPETQVLNNKVDLEKFISREDLITKSIGNTIPVKLSNEVYAGYTSEVRKSDTINLNNNFMLSLFQKKINKKYEIRSFLLNKKFYSMAIFSQADAQTSVDFRKYNYHKPNRTVPYNLPLNVEQKLLALSERLGLKTGSFDLIKTYDNNYVFLEVNPSGQFGMVSFPCNYYIEKKVAQALINF